MRQFDNLQSYLDNLGEPFIGRARFCNVIGEPQKVKDCDGNVIDSVVYTDSSGRLSVQVFLDDVDYKVVFEKYTGESNMAEDDDDLVWEFQFESYSLYDTFGIHVDTVGTQCVPTMNDLRELNPETVGGDGGFRIVRLLGYEVEGDKPVVDYVFDSSDRSGDDDGGSIIKPANYDKGGRWHLIVPTKEIDVRHFGVFPNPGPSVSGTQENGIANASRYSSSTGLPLFFPTVKNNVYYGYKNVTLNNVICSRTARIFNSDVDGSDDSSALTIVGSGNVYAYADSNGHSGKVVIEDDVVRTSFNANNSRYVSLRPISKVIFDVEDYVGGSKWNDVDVVLEKDQSNESFFERCSFSGPGKFVNGAVIHFTECDIKGSYFEDDFDFSNCSFDKCFSDPRNWGDGNICLQFFVMNGNLDIDLKNSVVTKLPDIPVPTTLRNATLNLDDERVDENWTFVGCTFMSKNRCDYWTCTNCTFLKSPVISRKYRGPEASLAGSFAGCIFNNGTNVEADIGDQALIIFGIVEIVNCVFESVDPIKPIHFLPATEYKIKTIRVEDNVGALWSTSEFSYDINEVRVHIDDSTFDKDETNVCLYKAAPVYPGAYNFKLHKFSLSDYIPMIFKGSTLVTETSATFSQIDPVVCKREIRWQEGEVIGKTDYIADNYQTTPIYASGLSESGHYVDVHVRCKLYR